MVVTVAVGDLSGRSGSGRGRACDPRRALTRRAAWLGALHGGVGMSTVGKRSSRSRCVEKNRVDAEDARPRIHHEEESHGGEGVRADRLSSIQADTSLRASVLGARAGGPEVPWRSPPGFRRAPRRVATATSTARRRAGSERTVPGVSPLRSATSLGTYTFLARRHGWKAPLDQLLVQGCLKEARQLAASDRDEPAALFYVFSKAWARLGDACAVLPDLLARNHARAVGLALLASPDEQRALRLRIAEGGVPFEEVRSWFASGLRQRRRRARRWRPLHRGRGREPHPPALSLREGEPEGEVLFTPSPSPGGRGGSRGVRPAEAEN